MSKVKKTYIYEVADQEYAEELSLCAAKIYSKALSLAWKRYEKGYPISNKTIREYMDKVYRPKNNFPLHSQSQQGAYQQYFEAQADYFKAHNKYKKENNQAKLNELNPPYKTKKYQKVIYKKSAFALKENDNDSYLRISNGRQGEYIKLENYDLDQNPIYGELIYNFNKRKYELHLTVQVEIKDKNYSNDNILSIDLGQKHPMVCFNYKTKETIIYNGGELNSKIRYRNKELAKLQNELSHCQKYSKRYRKLKLAKDKFLGQLKNQIKDILQKYVSHLIGYCLKNKVSTIVVGDIKGIRESMKFYKVVNQNLHQWMFRQLKEMLEQSSSYVDINFATQKEQFTSQSCPKCGARHKPQGRNFNCPKCNFSFHRDGIGALNIYRKYQNESLESTSKLIPINDLERPQGIRYNPHLKSPIDWNNNPFKEIV